MSKSIKADSFASQLKNTKLNKKNYVELYKKSIEDISKSIYGKSKVGMRYSWRHINSAEKKKKRSKK